MYVRQLQNKNILCKGAGVNHQVLEKKYLIFYNNGLCCLSSAPAQGFQAKRKLIIDSF
jgi:hypothetical protein